MILKTIWLHRLRLDIKTWICKSNAWAVFMADCCRSVKCFCSKVNHFWKIAFAFLTFICLIRFRRKVIGVLLSRFSLTSFVSVVRVICWQLIDQILYLTGMRRRNWRFYNLIMNLCRWMRSWLKHLVSWDRSIVLLIFLALCTCIKTPPQLLS